MQVAIYGRPSKGQTLDAAIKLISTLQKQGIEWRISDKIGEMVIRNGLKIPRGGIFFPDETLAETTAALFSIGGDGTILESVSIASAQQIPIVGIHTGRLGFLASIPLEGIEDIVTRLKTKNYLIDRRSLVSLSDEQGLFDGRNFALNEFAIMKRDSSAMITVHTQLNGSYLNSYWADGLITSTPTGSTGYSLSCGGPIITPDNESFILTPVSPHNLNVRPLIVPDSSVFTYEVEGRSKKVLVSLDTRSRPVEITQRFSVQKAPFKALFVRIQTDDFIETLRSKLYWGADLRN